MVCRGPNQENAPWAFSKGKPYRTVAALELYATLVSLVVFSGNWPQSSTGQMTISASTDNAGNAQAMARLMSSKFPLVVVMAELAAQLRARGLRLDLAWVPRAQNEEADELTNREYGRFRMENRIPVEVERLP